MADEKVRDLFAERQKNNPKGVSREGDGMTVNGGIGDGVNSGGPAYHICVDCPHGHDTETESS